MPDNDRTKTKDKLKSPFDDLTMPKDERSGNLTPGSSSSPVISPTSKSTPDLGRASADQTRSATANISHTSQMRDLMSRMRDVGDDEISDVEAARRAGLAPAGGGAPGITPVTPENLPAVRDQLPKTVKQDLATISQEIKTRDGKVFPKWHEIKHLPGYMQRAIRAMGRGMFKMFTNTDVEDIITIANVGGQGPNSNLEMQAVAAWLQKNAEDLGSVNIDHSQIMPGYNPEVKEYRTDTTRFHVVRDPFGVYIYAYPEKDSVEYHVDKEITGPVDDDVERDEYGARIKKLKEGNTMTHDPKKIRQISEWINNLDNPQNQETPKKSPTVKNTLTEANIIKWHTTLLEDVQADAALESYAEKILQEFIEETEVLDEASTLIPLLKDVPGGEQMAQYLHRHDKVAATAEWDKVPSGDRVQLKLFKASPDYHMVIVGKNGIASAKPDLADFTAKAQRHGPNWKGDNTLLYQVVAWSGDQRVDNMLIPDEYEYEVDKNGEETDKIKKERVWDDDKQKYVERPIVRIDNSALRRRGTLNPNAAPTIITIKRAGRPFQKEPGGQQNFFDMLKGAIGNVDSVYVATSKVGGMPRRDIANWIKDYKAGLIPAPSQATGEKFISSPKGADIGTKKGSAKVWDPEEKKWVWGLGSERVPAGTRTSGASARDIVGSREKSKTEFRPGQFIKQADTPQGIALALRPVIDKFMHKKFAELKDRIARYTAAENDDAAEKAVSLRKNIREIMTALDTSTPNWSSTPLRKLTAVIDQSVSNIAGEGEDKKEIMRQISQLRAPLVQEWWNDFKRQLDKTDVFSRYFY